MKLMITMMVLFLGLSLPCASALAGQAVNDTVANRQGSVDEAQLQKLQSRMQGDAQVMTMISALQNDPEMKALLSDPSFMKAINSRDIGALTSDPRFVKLFSNPRVQDIIKRVEQ